MKGSYLQHGEVFGRLMAQVKATGQTPTGPLFGRYFDNPEETPEAELTWEVGVPVAADTKATAPFELRDIPGGTTAVLVHEGPWESSGPAWGKLIQWVLSNGYQPIGSPMQIYHGDPSGIGANTPRTELRLPVTR
jgi:effector-binding domain-containing protein